MDAGWTHIDWTLEGAPGFDEFTPTRVTIPDGKGGLWLYGDKLIRVEAGQQLPWPPVWPAVVRAWHLVLVWLFAVVFFGVGALNEAKQRTQDPWTPRAAPGLISYSGRWGNVIAYVLIDPGFCGIGWDYYARGAWRKGFGWGRPYRYPFS